MQNSVTTKESTLTTGLRCDMAATAETTPTTTTRKNTAVVITAPSKKG
jgi:hypothetical protein